MITRRQILARALALPVATQVVPTVAQHAAIQTHSWFNVLQCFVPEGEDIPPFPLREGWEIVWRNAQSHEGYGTLHQAVAAPIGWCPGGLTDDMVLGQAHFGQIAVTRENASGAPWEDIQV